MILLAKRASLLSLKLLGPLLRFVSGKKGVDLGLRMDIETKKKAKEKGKAKRERERERDGERRYG